MKRTLIACLLLALLCSFALAEEPEREIFVSGDFTYAYALLEDGTAEINKYIGSSANLAIPASLDGYAVTNIGNYAFSYCTGLTEVIIPDSVTSIGANPFRSCSRLTDIRVSSDHPALAIIDGVLFSKADKRLVSYPCAFTAETYSIPQGIVMIGDDAFEGCSGLTEVTIPDSVTNVGELAFFRCTGLNDVTIPESVTSIGRFAFSLCTGLTEVTIPDSVTSIGYRAFYGCTGLKTITVGRDSYAAQYCQENNLSYQYPDSLDWLNN